MADKRVDFGYDLAGNPTTLKRNRSLATPTTTTNAVADTAYTTDLAGRLTRSTHKPWASGAAQITNFAYYDRLGRVYRSINTDGANTYKLDDLGQVIANANTNPSPDEAYAFDAAGNRTADGASSYTVTANNRLASDGVDTYLYDGEGNRTRKTHFVNATTTIHTNYTYDYRNRLTSVVDRLNDPTTGAIQKQVQYTYDAFNRRASRQLDANGDNVMDRVERYIYDGDHVVLEYVDPDGAGSLPQALGKRYLYGPAVDQILAQENLDQLIGAENRVYWFLEDHQGTTRDLVNNAGKLVTHYVYDAFGEVISGDTSKTRYLYTGRELDTATGLQYNHHRWYDPRVGRWISEDPIGFGGGDYNLSRYVGNMATYMRDPHGLDAIALPAGVGLGAAAAGALADAGAAAGAAASAAASAAGTLGAVGAAGAAGFGVGCVIDYVGLNPFTPVLVGGVQAFYTAKQWICENAFSSRKPEEDMVPDGEGSKAMDQLESIEKAQERVRNGSDAGKRIIDSIKKTQDRLKNKLREPYDPSNWE